MDGTQVARYPPRGVETAADSNLRLAWQIRELAFESISRSQARLLILGRVTARGTPFVRLNANAVVLPMSRYDIADYLAGIWDRAWGISNRVHSASLQAPHEEKPRLGGAPVRVHSRREQ